MYTGTSDAEHAEGALELAAEEVRHPEEEDLLFAVLFVNDGVLVVGSC